ncbi:MAG: GNAT family N-acetyltransferase [Thermodesulfobacteriota bacterium]
MRLIKRFQKNKTKTAPDPDGSGPWLKKVTTPEKVLSRIRPGMNIFLGTGVAEPRTLVKKLLASKETNLTDLELVQLVSFGDAVSFKDLYSQRFRLKTFFSGWVAREAIREGRVDLIPSRFSRIPRLVESGQIPIDAAFIQITPPNEAGYCSLGVAVDVAQHAMERASLVVGEINTDIPVTYGDSFVHVSDFDLLVYSTEPPLYFPRWPVDAVYDRIAAHVSALIDDGSCIAFSIGPLFEALGRHLVHKRHLGIHSPFFTDPLMDLVKSGAVTNRRKKNWRGKSLVSYAFGTEDLMAWLDRNPLVEFQGVDMVFDPNQMGENPGFVVVHNARKIDLSGSIALNAGKGNVPVAPADQMDFFFGAELSPGGRNIFALPSRNREGEPKIVLSIKDFPNQLSVKESADLVVTEYGVASLRGKTLRERAMALIDIAHPEDRPLLVEQAKREKIIYQDQMFPAACDLTGARGAAVPSKVALANGTTVSFRPIKPSDEEKLRRLFYRFSDKSVYNRYFNPIKSMPHEKIQEYVNIDCDRGESLVGVVGESGNERIIAEARYVRDKDGPMAEVAFAVDDAYQGLHIARHMYNMLIQLARDRGIKGFTAEVLESNKQMLSVFKSGDLTVTTRLIDGVYSLEMPFSPDIS